MADAEKDRLDLNARIERLEMDKQELEAENAVQIEENRALLDQLEVLNNTVSESDTKIKALEASLLSSQQAVRRLESAAARAADAERHLALLEQEQAELQQDLICSREDARSHAQRFKEAQRGIMDMQDQLERMEMEAREERNRHAEVVERMERQREVEKHLDTAAGRLKGAAASKSLQETKSGNPAVSHFVRDLLQDNANLQLGMAELREMLLNSNDEIQLLREQLVHHQPTDTVENTLNLQAELQNSLGLENPTNPRVSQELHIHHHYHVTNKVTQKPENRKPRRKRHSLGLGPFSPSVSGTSTPNTSGQWRLSSPAPAALTLNTKEPNSVMSMPRQRWSTDQFSEFASSVPSSPQSNQRSSMFDPNMTDSDFPTSPITNYDPMSPSWRATHRKGPSEISALSFQAPSLQLDPGTPPMVPTRPHQTDHSTIHEEDEEEEDIARLKTPDLVAAVPSVDENSTIGDSDLSKDDFSPRPRIHRAMSHESIMSLSGGLDIHTLKVRPSQLTLRPLGGAEAIVTDINAQPTLSRGAGRRSALALRDHFAGLPAPRTVSNPLYRNRSASPNPSETSSQGTAVVGSLGKWVGWRPWGSSVPSTSPTAKVAAKAPEPEVSPFRASGINQPGTIPGFQQYWTAQRRKGAPAKVTPDSVNSEALEDGLRE